MLPFLFPSPNLSDVLLTETLRSCPHVPGRMAVRLTCPKLMSALSSPLELLSSGASSVFRTHHVEREPVFYLLETLPIQDTPFMSPPCWGYPASGFGATHYLFSFGFSCLPGFSLPLTSRAVFSSRFLCWDLDRLS